MNLRVKRSLLLFVLSLGMALPAVRTWAGATRSFVLDSAGVLAEGKLEGTAVASDGSITRGVATRRIELPGVALARSLLVMPDGTAYVGTGNDGKIYVVKDGAAVLFAETKQLLVSALATDGKGTLYAGTLPKGKIFAISLAGAALGGQSPAEKPSALRVPKELVTPKGAEHVWSMLYDDKLKTLFAATGPEGKIFAIDAAGKAEVYYDAEASHIMTLARDTDGTLYAGTSDQALLLRLRGAGRADVVYDFDGNEVTAIDVKNGELAVGANMFPRSNNSNKNQNQNQNQNPGSSGDASSPQASTPNLGQLPAQANPQVGKGQVFRIDRSGRAEKLFTADEGHITSIEWGDAGVIYAATGKDGHIHRVHPDHSHALWVDVDERQVLAHRLTGSHPMFVTGDGAAIYEVLTGPAQKPIWTSKVLDANVPARFGTLGWRGRGKASMQTRSGNTEKPDSAWSDWSAPLTAAGPIKSPAARFLQVRASLDTQAQSVVYAIEAFYLPVNQPPIVTEVSVEPPRLGKAEKNNKQSSSSTAYKVKWKAENADGDSLRYRVFYKEERSQTWRPLQREGEIVTGTEQGWETDGVPDGYYRMRVEASDELDNPEDVAQKHAGESEPLLIDNHPPQIEALRVKDGRITGTARDSLGPVTKLEYTVDGLEWKLLFPDDDLFDTASEPFGLALKLLPKGNHAIMFRATDARSNTDTAELVVDVP